MLDYYKDSELRVVESPEGYRRVGVSRRFGASSEALRGHVEAEREFRDGMERLLADFMEESEIQESEICDQIKHCDFFLREFKNHKWDANPMFDRLRLQYISQEDRLKFEKRQLRFKKIEKRMGFLKEIRESKKELSPFSRLF